MYIHVNYSLLEAEPLWLLASKKSDWSSTWWHKPVILAFQRLRQDFKFQVTLSYTARSCLKIQKTKQNKKAPKPNQKQLSPSLTKQANQTKPNYRAEEQGKCHIVTRWFSKGSETLQLLSFPCGGLSPTPWLPTLKESYTLCHTVSPRASLWRGKLRLWE